MRKKYKKNIFKRFTAAFTAAMLLMSSVNIQALAETIPDAQTTEVSTETTVETEGQYEAADTSETTDVSEASGQANDGGSESVENVSDSSASENNSESASESNGSEGSDQSVSEDSNSSENTSQEVSGGSEQNGSSEATQTESTESENTGNSASEENQSGNSEEQSGASVQESENQQPSEGQSENTSEISGSESQPAAEEQYVVAPAQNTEQAYEGGAADSVNEEATTTPAEEKPEEEVEKEEKEKEDVDKVLEKAAKEKPRTATPSNLEKLEELPITKVGIDGPAITFHAAEIMTGDELSDEDIEPGYELIVYDVPASAVDVTNATANVLASSRESEMMSRIMSGYWDLSAYKYTITVTSQNEQIEFIRNGDASASNPYIFLVTGVDATMGLPSAEWNAQTLVAYDDTSAYHGSEDATNGFTVEVYRDTSVFTAKIKVRLNSSEYQTTTGEDPFTVNAVATPLMSYYYGPGGNNMLNCDEQYTEDGTYEVELPFKISRAMLESLAESNQDMPVFFSIGINENENINLWTPIRDDNSGYNVLVCYRGTILVDDENYILAPIADQNYQTVTAGDRLEIEYQRAVAYSPSILVQFNDPSNAAIPEEDYPVYMKVAASDSYNSSTWNETKVFKIESAAEANQPLLLTFDSLVSNFNSENEMRIVFSFYKDQNCTVPHSSWANGTSNYYYYVTKNRDDGHVWSDWDYSTNTALPIMINYRYVNVRIPINTFASNPDIMYPAWVRITGLPNPIVTKIEGNGTTDAVVRLQNNYSVYRKYIYWSVYSDEQCTTSHTGWNAGGTIRLGGINNDRFYLYSGGSDNLVEINMSVCSTDTLSIPMTIRDNPEIDNECFPIYMEATLRSSYGYFTPVTINKTFTSAEQMNAELVFNAEAGELFDSNSPIDVSVTFSKDSAGTESADDLWSPAYLTGELGEDNKLKFQYSSEHLSIDYVPVSVTVKPDFYKVVPSHENPVTIVTTLNDGAVIAPNETIVESYGEFVANFSHYGFAGENYGASSIMHESGKTPDEETSAGTKFYSNENSGLLNSSGLLSNYGDGSPVILRPYESSLSYASVTIPVHVNVPADGGHFKYGVGSGDYRESIYVTLQKYNVAEARLDYVSYKDWNNDDDSYAYCLTDLEADSTDNMYNISLNIHDGTQGVYYMNYGLGSHYQYSNYIYYHSYNVDTWWTNENRVKVILTEEGELTYPDGTPVQLELYYLVTKPAFDVATAYPAEYDADANRYTATEFTPSFFSINLNSDNDSYYTTVYFRTGYTADGHMVGNVPEGASILGDANDRYDYANHLKTIYQDGGQSDYTGPAVVGNIGLADGSTSSYMYFGDDYFYKYNETSTLGVPEGDYTLTYSVGGDYSAKWNHVTGLRVHVGSDGKLYEIKNDGTYDTEPYKIQIAYIGDERPVYGTYDSLKIKVNTTVKEGTDLAKAFTENDQFVAVVTKDSELGLVPYFLTGTTQITEPGEITLELKNPGGGNVVINKETVYSLSFGTFHNYTGDFDGDELNNLWPTLNRLYSTYEESNTIYPSYFTCENIDADGNIMGFTYNPSAKVDNYNNVNYISRANDISGEIATIENMSLIVPWNKANPKTITQKDNADTTVYKPISSISAIKNSGNYIVVAHNAYNNKWYALYADEGGGNQILLDDVSSLADLEAGYKIDTSDEFLPMVYKASKLSPGENSVSLQLKSSFKNGEGKNVAIKMGESSDIPTPLLSGSAGTVIIYPDADKQFRISKGNYSWMWYVPEMYGWSGFRVTSNKFGPLWTQGEYHEIYGLYPLKNYPWYDFNKLGGSYGTEYGSGRSINVGVEGSGSYGYNTYVLDVDSKYLNETYYNRLRALDNYYPGIGTNKLYILSDDVEEDPQQPTNKYTQVKTYGDFVQTYVTLDSNDSAATNMVIIYTDSEGHEYAMTPGGLVQVATTAGSSGYRTLTTVADNELIPNNNSGTSAKFSINSTEVKTTGQYVFSTDYAFRKSRQNSTEDKNYLTMSGEDAWSKNDDASHGSGLVYVMHPTSNIYSTADWDSHLSYKLSVIRGDETKWLGIADDGNGGKKMTTVNSEADAVEFTVYCSTMKRYYSGVYGTDLYKYYKVSSLADIGAGDQIVIVYNDNGTKRVVGFPFQDYGRFVGGGDSYGIEAAVEVLSDYSAVDTRDNNLTTETKYQYRLDTEEYVKKPFAYIDPNDSSILWAQGIASNAIGPLKSESSNQRKFENVFTPARNNVYMYIKPDMQILYGWKAAETNFFNGPEPGTFYVRGGKSSTWLGVNHYQRYMLDLDTGEYDYFGNYLSYRTVAQADRIPVEIYRRPSTDASFTIKYHTSDNVLDFTEVKPGDAFTLTQKKDTEKDGVEYIFVGWTTDYDKSGYLSLSDSANLYDFDDLSMTAGIKRTVKAEFSLIGECNPEVSSPVSYSEIEDKVVDGVLKVWPVYAVKGYSTAITANDGEQMIIGASDFKDLQGSGTGVVNEKERWLGSINIEVYRDGDLWVPGTGGSTTGRRNLLGNSVQKATLYFVYHNDNAADLNIKFIEDGITKDTLYNYMSSDDFSATEPSNNYIIDAVWAEQGGSEDGLKYRYNWMTAEHGGQLDNVKGGSTVKIYITTKYQVKYYLDNDGTGYKELTGTAWQDDGYYATPGTINAVTAIKNNETDYDVTDDSTYENLLIPTPTNGATFKNEAMIRGEYSRFLYNFDEYPHTYDVAQLPGEDIIGAGKVLREQKWAIRDLDLQKTLAVDPETVWQMEGTSYGTGNTIHAVLGTAAPFANDTTHTYHLTLNVVSDIKVTKTVDSDNEADKQIDFPFRITLTDNVNSDPDKIVVNGIRGNVTFTNNVAEFTLKHGESKTAENIHAGMTFLVEELTPSGWRVKSSSGTTGTTVGGVLNEAEFTNERAAEHNISVSKTVAGNLGDKTDTFAFNITLSGDSVPTSVAYAITDDAGTVSSGNKDVTGGLITFEIGHGETFTATGLPEGISYVITETASNKNGYTTAATAALGTVTTNETIVTVSGTLTADETAAYTNTRNLAIPTGVDSERPHVWMPLIPALMLAFMIIYKRRKKLKIIK